MKLVVVGAGALGTYFGLRMHEAGHEVTFLVREGRHAQIQANGLKIESSCGNAEWLKPNIVTDANEIEAVDVAVVGVKGYHLDGVLPVLKTLADKGAVILPFLNGIEHMERLKEVVGEDHLLGGVAYIVAALNEKGHVIHTGDQHTFIFGSPSDTADEVCENLKDVSGQVKMDLVCSDNIERDMWQKYMFITAFSSITSATRLPIGPIRQSPPTLKLGEEVLMEMVALAKASGIQLPDAGVAGLEKLKLFPDEATSSMHQDLMHDRPMEVDHLLGGALRLAETHGIDMPHVETLYAVLKPHESGK